MTTEILITGGAGFIGQELVAPLLATSPNVRLTLTDMIEPPVPSSVSANDATRITSIKADLTSPDAVSSLFSRRFAAVYVLHGLMSGGTEANLDLGLKVNVDSVRCVLDHLRRDYPGTVVVFASSCAVYGPLEPVRELETLPQPRSSYGAQKLMDELLLNDYSRKGLLDGRIVRLPTVVVRPGAPSAAASSFASGIIRESLKGVKNTLPVGRDLALWVCSPATVVKNLVAVKDVPSDKFGGSRIVNLPGITVTVQQMLDALEQVGGKQALDMIEEKADTAVQAIVESWPARFDVSRAYGLGLSADGEFVEAVKAFKSKL